MAQTVKERIAERTAIADEQLQYQGFFGRMANRTGLAVANLTDNIVSAGDTHPMAFVGGSMLGLLQGATLGGAAGFALVGMGMVPAVLAGAPAILTIAAVGAAVSGLYHGVQATLYHHRHQDDKRIADRIAESFGTVPEQAHQLSGHVNVEPVASTPPNGWADPEQQRLQSELSYSLREERRRERKEERHDRFR